MKRLLFLGVAIVVVCSCGQQSKRAITPDSSYMEFTDTVFNLGKLYIDDSVKTYRFEYYNYGDKPLLIYDIHTSCGCTKVEYSKKPLKSGNKQWITLKYNSEDAVPTYFTRTVTVYSNAVNSPVILRVYGDMVYR